MPDGSTFLCGDMPHQPGETASTALITHLGKAGTVISEQLVEINGSDAKKTSYSFVSCTRLQEGFVALAYEHHIPGPGEAGISGSSFVLVQFGKNGRATWTRHFEPIEPGFNPATTTVQRLGQSLAVTSTDNNSTEIATFTLEGDVISRKSLALPYIAIRGDEAADQLEIFGPSTIGGADDTLKHVFTFDSHLRETSRQSGSAPTRFAPNVIYRMPDQSLIFFGSQVKLIEGSVTSGIRHVNKDLTKEETIRVDQEGFSDSGSIWAAAPTSNPKQFAVARTFAPSLAVRERGAVIDFINLEK
jgi:hypothetical protein